MKKYLLIFIISVCFLNKIKAENNCGTDSIFINSDTTNSQKTPLTTRQKWIIGGLVAQQAASMYMEYQWWWEGDYHAFVVHNDGGFNNYSLGIDKVGHFYTSYMYSNLLYELLKWGDFSDKSSVIVSTVIPFVWALSIEIGDGFSSYEFSPTDLLANTLGIGYAFAQRKIPYLNNFKFKFSYFPSKYYIDNGFGGWALTSDYDGHIYWLSVDIHNMLPAAAKQYWTKYLNLGIGYGVYNFTTIDKAHGNIAPGVELQREFMLGLDYNIHAIDVNKSALRTIRNMVDYYHFPAPGFKKTGGESWKFQPLILN